MKFRDRKITADPEFPLESTDEILALDTNSISFGRSRWSTAFLVVGSALLGATAIAFWNRRTIASMRSQIQSGIVSAVPPRHTDEEIF